MPCSMCVRCLFVAVLLLLVMPTPTPLPMPTTLLAGCQFVQWVVGWLLGLLAGWLGGCGCWCCVLSVVTVALSFGWMGGMGWQAGWLDGSLGGWVFVSHLGWAAGGGGGGGVCGSHNGYSETFALLWQTNDNGEDDDDEDEDEKDGDCQDGNCEDERMGVSMVGWLAGWLAGWMDGWVCDWVVGWLAGRMAVSGGCARAVCTLGSPTSFFMLGSLNSKVSDAATERPNDWLSWNVCRFTGCVGRGSVSA